MAALPRLDSSLSLCPYGLPPTLREQLLALSCAVARWGGETVKSPSTAFLAELEEDWRNHGKEIFPILREKYPQAYFQGIVSLARIIRWDVDPTGAFDRARCRAAACAHDPKYRKLLSNDPQSRQRFLKRVGDNSV
jgi:hypothetical protein